MGGFGPPLPGRRGYPQYGQRYGVQQPPEGLVPYKTPVANQIVDGINQFVDNFKGSQEANKQAARQRFLEGIQMMQLGLPVDQKKMARDARTAGLNFDYEGPTRAEQAQQQQPPMPGMPTNGGMQPQMGGGGMPPQQGPPMPGDGGRGFFGRLGAALTQPFQAPPPIPGNAGVYQALDQMQQRAALEQQKNFELAKMAVDYLKTGSPELAAKLAANKVLDLPDTLQSILTISSQLGKGDPGKTNDMVTNGLRSAYDELTGVSKAAAEHEQRIDQFARSMADGYENMEDARAAAKAIVETGKLPDGLQPTKAANQRMQAIAEKALELRTKFRTIKAETAWTIASAVEDPSLPEEAKIAELAKLDNLQTIDDERLKLAESSLNVALANLGIRKTETEHDALVRSKLANYLISSSNMVNGILDYTKARAQIQEDANNGLNPGLKDLVPEMMTYLDRAQQANIQTVQMQALLRFINPNPVNRTTGTAPMPDTTGNGTYIPDRPPGR
jgi:hypothetical protein